MSTVTLTALRAVLVGCARQAPVRLTAQVFLSLDARVEITGLGIWDRHWIRFRRLSEILSRLNP